MAVSELWHIVPACVREHIEPQGEKIWETKQQSYPLSWERKWEGPWALLTLGQSFLASCASGLHSSFSITLTQLRSTSAH